MVLEPTTQPMEIIPSENREHLGKIICFKVSEPEQQQLLMWRKWLATTPNPQTGDPFIEAEEWSQMVQFAINAAYSMTAEVARQQAEAEGR